MVREDINRSRTEANLKRLCSTALTIGQQTGHLPTNLGTLWASAGFASNPAMAIDGYTMFLPSGSPVRLIAEPLAGRSGGETISADVRAGCPLTESPTPGADRGLSLMLENTLISGYSLIGRMSDGTSNTIMYTLAARPIQPDLTALAGTDGRYSFLALQQAMEVRSRSFDADTGALLRGFVQQSFGTLELGANGEQWTTFPSTAITTTAVTVKDLSSLDTLATLTSHRAARPDAVPELLALIQSARTDPSALDIYIAKAATAANPAAPGGAVFTSQDAQALITLARILR
jgi:hypothetical protein